MKYLLRYAMGPSVDSVRIGELFPAHRQHWSAFQADGTLVAIGPMENPADGALGVFTTREAARRFAETDPFVTGGVVQTWDVSGWQEAILDPPSDSHPG